MNKQPKTVKNAGKKSELSIIILTYNSQEDLPNCLNSLYKYNLEQFVDGVFELIVIDNASSDDTVKNLKESRQRFPNLKIIENKQNLGFGPANNLAAKIAKGESVLFLNPDTVVENDSIKLPLQYLNDHPDVGALSAKLILGNGTIDMTCHRGFPTPWNSFCFFSGLSKIFPKSKLFSGYTLGYLNLNEAHEVDAINGAFLLLPATLGQKINFFDPDFFWKGEDLDICYRIKELGYKIIYLPQAVVHHYKGSSKGHQRGSKTLKARFEVMRLFYDKHYKNKYPAWMRNIVLVGIKIRYLIAYVSGK